MEFQPYTHGQSLSEFTFKAVLAGIVLGLVFGGANVYLGLVAGLTISTSIPVAVLTVVVFRTLFGKSGYSILELNTSQTVGSASSSVASGVLFTMPALFMWGMPPSWRQMTLLAMCGGLLGVLAMIPLRRYLIKQEHGNLPYPEGTACAEVLIASQQGGNRATGIFHGFIIGIVFKLITGLKIVKGTVTYTFPHMAYLSAKVSPALIGVGYILGMRVASVMVSGGALAAFVLIPAIYLFGQGMVEPLAPETDKLIKDMSIDELWERYVRYIGAGAVATGGFMTLIRSIPTMWQSFRVSIAQLTGSGKSDDAPRTDSDLPLHLVALLVTGVLLILALVPGILGSLEGLWQRALAAVLVAVFAFFFVTVSARIVGLVGVTSNPTSGMTIATLIGTSLIFYMMGWTDAAGKATALMVGTAVCIASSIAGDTSQDLKTGFLLGATPRFQQIGELIGVITSAGVVCMVLILLDRSVADSGGLGSSALPAPQGTLMKLVIDGVLEAELPWGLVLIGVGIAVVAAVLRLPVLAFAVGVYLPLSTMAAVFFGGLLRHWLTSTKDVKAAESRREQGVLIGSGMVGGEGLTGVMLAMIAVFLGGSTFKKGFPLPVSETVAQWIGVGTIVMILAALARGAMRQTTSDDKASI